MKTSNWKNFLIVPEFGTLRCYQTNYEPSSWGEKNNMEPTKSHALPAYPITWEKAVYENLEKINRELERGKGTWSCPFLILTDCL
jgi:hypothetical protein